MKTVVLFIVLLVLGGCGDSNYQEQQPLPTKTCIFYLASTSFNNYSTNY